MSPLTPPFDSLTPIYPGQTLGVLGGGQLGRMFCQAAHRMGYKTAVLDPDARSPAGLISHHHIVADYGDEAALSTLSGLCAGITTEFENVPAHSLSYLAEHTTVSPHAEAVAIAQDRSAEKSHFSSCGIATAPYINLYTKDDCTQVSAHNADLFPGILKTARLGYDGKGQIRLSAPTELALAWEKLGSVACVLEKQLPLQKEISVVVARGVDGACVHLPVQHNLHRNGILAVTEVYGDENDLTHQHAVESAKAIAHALHYVGVLCVEFFILQDGSLVVNEMAPRPHNSGHYSMDACDVSQFDLQLRTLCRLPLVQPVLQRPSIMLNLLGDIWLHFNNAPPWGEVLAHSGVSLHLYGKSEARSGRKMGHITVCAAHPDEVKNTALKLCNLLGLPAF